MYKFFSLVFFTCTVSIISILFIATDTDLKWKFVWIIAGIAALAYIIFFFYVLFTSIFKIRNDTFIGKIFNFFGSKVSFVSNRMELVKNIFTFIFVVFIGAVTIGAAFRFVVYASIKIFPNQITSAWEILKSNTSKSNIESLNKEIMDLKKRSFDNTTLQFFERNEKSYSSDVTFNSKAYTVNLLYINSESGDGFNTKENFSLMICPKLNSNSQNKSDEVCIPTLQGNPMVVFDSNETIKGIGASTHKIADLKDTTSPLIVVTVRTDKRSNDYLLYPQYTYDDKVSMYGAFPTIKGLNGYSNILINTFIDISFSNATQSPSYMYTILGENSTDIEKLGYSLTKYQTKMNKMVFVFDRDTETNTLHISQVMDPREKN